jgi:predicted phosphodiesterase
MKITLISDTHAKHNRLRHDLPGGDIIIHAGDFMTSGYSQREAEDFFNWYNSVVNNYDTKIFISGNHDRIMQNESELMKGLLTGYKTIDYLEDDWINIGENDDVVRVYGSPWQPEFYNWAYNLPRNGEELKARWDAIPDNTDILVTHGPAWGFVDDVEGRRGTHLGCELLAERIKGIRPKIHVCGHIHSGYGHYFDGHTHYFNASALNERYEYAHLPWNLDWNPITNEIVFL